MTHHGRHNGHAYRYRQVAGPDGQGYTDVWVDGLYTRLQSLEPVSVAIAMVLSARKWNRFR